MRAYLFVITLMSFATAHAQLQIPEASPPGKVIQKIGFTTLEVYSERPAARGRSEGQIFGKLVRPLEKCGEQGQEIVRPFLSTRMY